jgi:hypothetical protein
VGRTLRCSKGFPGFRRPECERGGPPTGNFARAPPGGVVERTPPASRAPVRPVSATASPTPSAPPRLPCAPWFAAALLLAPTLLPAQAAARVVEWAAMETEAVDALQQYLRINTSNPPGNELASARWLKAFPEKEGIEARLLDTVELGAGRAHPLRAAQGERAHARHRPRAARGGGPVTPACWAVPAFEGAVKDGHVYGRGALDRKGKGSRASWHCWNAILRNTISITGLQGSPKTKVIPAETWAGLDVRLLPNERPEDMIAT